MNRQGVRFAVALGAVLALQGGQSTPSPNEGLHRTIQEDRVTRGKAKEEPPPQDAPSGAALNTVLSSTGDLNAVRDAYLRRLAGDGCAPDVAVRVAQIRARLHQEAAPGAQQSSVEIEAALSALALDWYKNPLGDSGGAPGTNVASSREAERGRLLNAALVSREQAAAPLPQSAETPQALQAELDRLLAGCRAPAR